MGDISDEYLEDLKKRVREIQTLHQEVEEGTKQFKDSINKSYKDLDQLLNRLKSKEKDIKQLKITLGQGSSSSDAVRALRQQLNEEEKSIKSLYNSLAPRTGSLFVRLFLGRVNVKHYRDGERFRLKEEYQKFKSKTDIFFLVAVLIQLFIFPDNSIIELLFQTWLLYYYTTLALRENILKVNGSNIRTWWIFHHYLSVAVSLLVLTWSHESHTYKMFFPQFLFFSLFQALVQILQSRYQSAKLYKLIAMGHASTMDVSGETLLHTGSHFLDFTPSMTVLLPFLLFVQLFQVYHSYTLLQLAFYQNFHVEWQVVGLGGLFLALGVGNLTTTLDTYFDKLKAA